MADSMVLVIIFLYNYLMADSMVLVIIFSL
jgi:hypothetical protein